LKELKIRKLGRLIGPYPYNPYFIFLIFFALFLSRFSPVIPTQPFGLQRWLTTAVVLSLSLIPSSLFALIAYIFQKYRPWSSKNLFAYICEVAIGQSALILCAPFIREILRKFYHFNFQSPLTLTPGFFLGSLMIALIMLALMHKAERKILDRLDLANNLVSKLESERIGLIHSDEKLRRHASQFLHDRVQSDLMVVGMKLKSISKQTSPEVSEIIEGAILRLENTRASDLRNLIQILTPNLEAGGLHSAFDVLLEQYRADINVTVQIGKATEGLGSQVLLGIFRIVEQSILNSLVHGPASRIQISVNTNSECVTEIIVSDDGPGASIEEVVTGVGTAIIDSWVGILKGIKEIDSAPGHGYQLRVTFPK